MIDDTLAAKKGEHVFGIGCHLDAVRSTKRFRVFCFGHCWVVLAILVRVPFSRRPWALPILFRLYRNKKECTRKRHPYRKKTELARDMLDVFHRWVGDQRVEVAADAAYCNDTVTRGLPTSFVLFGAMRPDAVLTELPDERAAAPTGRRRRRGPGVTRVDEVARALFVVEPSVLDEVGIAVPTPDLTILSGELIKQPLMCRSKIYRGSIHVPRGPSLESPPR